MEEKTQLQQLKKEKIIFDDIRDKFKRWRFNMFLCTILYVIFFIIANIIIKKIVQKKAPDWIASSENLIIALTAVILGICFIADSIVTSHLKTPLQRLSIKMEHAPVDEKKKNTLLRITQETNELFKETLKKFGILVIPPILTSIIDNPGTDSGGKRSEHPLFYICYLIPILFAAWRIWQVNRELNKLEKKILDETKEVERKIANEPKKYNTK